MAKPWLGTTPPTDSVICRLYEGVLVYGQPTKVRRVFTDSQSLRLICCMQAIIHEKVWFCTPMWRNLPKKIELVRGWNHVDD